MKNKFNSILIITLFSFLGFSTSAMSQTDPWTILAMVDKESKFDDMMGMITEKAIPQAPALAMDGKEIEVNGYIIALAAKTQLSHFMFSRYPQNMCFFCGAAGAESAMQVFMKKGKKVDFSSEKVRLKGLLTIQQGDASGLIYTLSNAEIIKD